MIYIIRADDYIKIGYSKTKGTAYGRINQIQTANPHRIEVIKITDGGLLEEHKLHKMLDHYRFRAEWYKPDPVLLAIIDALPGI